MAPPLHRRSLSADLFSQNIKSIFSRGTFHGLTTLSPMLVSFVVTSLFSGEIVFDLLAQTFGISSPHRLLLESFFSLMIFFFFLVGFIIRVLVMGLKVPIFCDYFHFVHFSSYIFTTYEGNKLHIFSFVPKWSIFFRRNCSLREIKKNVRTV